MCIGVQEGAEERRFTWELIQRVGLKKEKLVESRETKLIW